MSGDCAVTDVGVVKSLSVNCSMPTRSSVLSGTTCFMRDGTMFCLLTLDIFCLLIKILTDRREFIAIPSRDCSGSHRVILHNTITRDRYPRSHHPLVCMASWTLLLRVCVTILDCYRSF